jgi:hypothetical protein
MIITRMAEPRALRLASVAAVSFAQMPLCIDDVETIQAEVAAKTSFFHHLNSF